MNYNKNKSKAYLLVTRESVFRSNKLIEEREYLHDSAKYNVLVNN